MPRKPLVEKDPKRGERFQEVCRLLFPGLSRSEIARELGGISPSTVRNWENGQGVSRSILSTLEKLGGSTEYLLYGTGEPLREPASADHPGESAAVLSPAECLAANLRFLRKERFPGWGGQRRFAEFLGISPNDLCVYEYGRAIPNEQRLEDMAARLSLQPEALTRLLPGNGNVPSLPRGGVEMPVEFKPGAGLRRDVDALRREVIRLEAQNELLTRQVAEREARIAELMERNQELQTILAFANTPEGVERRRKLLERIEASLTDERGVF